MILVKIGFLLIVIDDIDLNRFHINIIKNFQFKTL